VVQVVAQSATFALPFEGKCVFNPFDRINLVREVDPGFFYLDADFPLRAFLPLPLPDFLVSRLLDFLTAVAFLSAEATAQAGAKAAHMLHASQLLLPFLWHLCSGLTP